MYIDAFSVTIIAHSIYKLSKGTLRGHAGMLSDHTSCVRCCTNRMWSVFISLMFNRLLQQTEKAGREGDVALGLTNDLDSWVWISFTFIAASKCTSLSLRIHMAIIELERIQKQPTGRLFLISIYPLTPSLAHYFTHSKYTKKKEYIYL